MAADPWVVTAGERVKHEEQFKTLRPAGGFITGEQAKGFFLQSRLPPQVLGLIWALSDVDGDGRMDLHEFSIACKLINLKLRGFSLPQTLPPGLKQSACPSSSATSSPMVAPAGGVAMAGMGGSGQPLVPGLGGAPAAAPLVAAPPVAPIAPVAVAPVAVAPVAVAPVAVAQPVNVAPAMQAGLGGVAPGMPAVPAPPAAQAQMQRTASQESGGSQTPGEWAVPQQSKLKFTQVFNMSDKAKSGYLSGVQARNILIQSQLPQQALAQIWALSDVDGDGRLSCEEFVLAMYLCESAKAGNKVPPVLPPELIPPTNRRQRTASVHSAGSGGTPVAEMLADNSFEDKRRENFEKGQAELERRRKALLDAQRRETEERLRREREEEAKREKARMEAEKRRQEELEREMQRQREIEAQKEQDRKRQEELREQARKDAELQRQQEWEKQRLQELMNVRQRQQENLLSLKAKNQSLGIELSTKEERVKELTQKISETRVGVTEIKATIDTMRTTRDTHMADMNQLKAAARDQNQRLLTLNQEKARLKARSTAAAGQSGAEQAAVDASLTNKQMIIKQLQEKVDELEKEFSAKEEDVNNNISDLNSLKSDLEATADRCKDIYDEYSTKRDQVLKLREKLINPDMAWGDEGTTAWPGKGFGAGDSVGSAWAAAPPTHAWTGSSSGHDASAQLGQFSAGASNHLPARPPPPSTTTLPSTTTATVDAEAGQPPARPDPPTNWTTNNTLGWGGTSPTPSSTTTPTTTTTTTTTSTTLPASEEPAGEEAGEARRFRALYQFDARNHDELSFMPGDVITVTQVEGAEPGWMGGELHGQTGWFPEAYCEPMDKTEAPVAQETISHTQLENIPEENVAPAAGEQRKVGEAVAVFPWRAKQQNHLSFNKGDRVTIREQQDQWWFGEVEGSAGWFPHSFVRMVSGPDAATSPVTTPQQEPEEPPMPDNLVNDQVSEFYQALYPYESGEPGDLNFGAGEVILVVKKEGDWWHGVVNQTSGIFPSNYVQIMPNQLSSTGAGDDVGVEAGVEQQIDQQEVLPEEEVSEKPSQEPATVQTPDSANLKVNQEVMELAKSPKSPKAGKGKKPEIAQVIAPYDATSSNQLSLQRGQLVMIRKKTASGWWEGELQAKGKKRQVGWFPASYVKVLGGSSRSTPVSMELTNREDMPPDNLQTPPTAQPPVTQVTITPPADDPMAGRTDPSNGFAEQVEALYPYTAMNDDELTFEAGAIISVIDKEDAAWWKGTVEGAVGVFPSNYVQPYPSTDAKAASPDAEFSLCYGRSDGVDAAPLEAAPLEAAPLDTSTPHERRRQNVIQEIVETEAAYLRELKLVEQAFIAPMRASSLVTEKELDMVFVNWNELVLVNSYFNKALKVRRVNSRNGVITMIGDVLCQQISQLTPYLRFCSIQLQGATLLGEKCGPGGPWAGLMKTCQEQQQVQGHTLTSFLLKPMQRITKYPLLIQQLIKYTPEGHPDYHNTQEAFSAATTLCAQVNEAVSQRENTDKLEWMQRQVVCEGLQERLVFNSLTNSLGPRKVLHIGVLHKAKSKRELVAYLLSDFMLLTTPSKSVASCTSLAALERALQNVSCTMYRKPMFLTELRVDGDGESEVCLRVSSAACGEVLAAAPTHHERNNWVRKVALAQKHLQDTERSLLQRKQSREREYGVVGRVLVGVMAGVSLEAAQGNLQSFCEVSVGSQVHRTSTAPSPHPNWDSTMQFLVKDLLEDVLCITVYEKGYFKPNEFLGRTELRIEKVAEECQSQPVAQPQVYKLHLQEANSGEVILKISLQLFDRQ